jgi:hypothetical protein
MYGFVLILLLFGTSGQEETISLDGFENLNQCQNFQMFFLQRPYIVGDDKVVYKLASASCLREKQA